MPSSGRSAVFTMSVESIFQSIESICREDPGKSPSVLLRLHRAYPGQGALVVKVVNHFLRHSPYGPTLRSKLVTNGIDLKLDLVQGSLEESPSVLFLDCLTKDVQEYLRRQGIDVEVKRTLVETQYGHCVRARAAALRATLLDRRATLMPPRPRPSHASTSNFVRANGGQGHVVGVNVGYAQPAPATATGPGAGAGQQDLSNLTALITTLHGKVDTMTTNLQSSMSNQVQLTGRVDDMQTSLSEVQQQTALLMQSEGRWREEALRLQRRVTRLEEGMAHQMRGGEAMSSRRALSMGGGGAGGLLQGFGGGGRLVPPARHSTNVRQTTYHRAHEEVVDLTGL